VDFIHLNGGEAFALLWFISGAERGKIVVDKWAT